MPTYCGVLTHLAVNNAFDTGHLDRTRAELVLGGSGFG
jgi:hypothetical protein